MIMKIINFQFPCKVYSKITTIDDMLTEKYRKTTLVKALF